MLAAYALNCPRLAFSCAANPSSIWPLAVVSLTAADGTLGIPTTAGDPVPLAGAIAPGASTTGSYVFMLDPAAGRTVSVTVNYAAAEPVAVFTGKAT